MSKLGCPCGHSIVDQTDYIPYKGRVSRDQDNTVWEKAWDDLADLVAAAREGREAEWVSKQFPGAEGERIDSVIMFYLSRIERDHMLDAFECTACGRLLVQRDPHENTFVSYFPDSGKYERVLASK